MDKKFICLSCGETYADGETYCCQGCGDLMCPKCGEVIELIKDYEETMRINAREDNER